MSSREKTTLIQPQKNQTDRLPAGCYSIKDLRKRLRIKDETLRNRLKQPSCPEPAGHYIGKNFKKCAYYNLKIIKKWLNDPDTATDSSSEEDSGWCIPRHTLQESQQCLLRRQLDHILSTTQQTLSLKNESTHQSNLNAG